MLLRESFAQHHIVAAAYPVVFCSTHKNPPQVRKGRQRKNRGTRGCCRGTNRNTHRACTTTTTWSVNTRWVSLWSRRTDKNWREKRGLLLPSLITKEREWGWWREHIWTDGAVCTWLREAHPRYCIFRRAINKGSAVGGERNTKLLGWPEELSYTQMSRWWWNGIPRWRKRASTLGATRKGQVQNSPRKSSGAVVFFCIIRFTSLFERNTLTEKEK